MRDPKQIKALVICEKCGQKQPVAVSQWQGADGWPCLNCKRDLSGTFEQTMRDRVKNYAGPAKTAAKWVDKYGGDKADRQKIARYMQAREELDKVRDLAITAGEWRLSRGVA